MFPRYLYLGSFAAVAFGAIGPVTDLHIVNKRISPDGFERSATLAEGTFPGPIIKGNKGDRFQINVINQLEDDSMLKTTTIHWHGIFQKGTNWADGGAMVSQCPIASGKSFLYDFHVPDQAGTFWYHSHLKTQYCDGLRGPLIVYDPDDPHKGLYDVDDDTTVITLADWYHTVAPIDEKLPLAIPDAVLINGLGQHVDIIGTLLGQQPPLAVVNVQRGKRYRFRLVSISCDPKFTFSIDNHPLTIIEADGVNTRPLTVDSLDIAAGQRYSVVLNANQPVNNYWIRAEPSFPGIPSTGLSNRNKAILRYQGARNSNPTTLGKLFPNAMKETDLHALEKPGAPGRPDINGADFNVNLVMGIHPILAPPFIQWTMNGKAFVPPTVPVLLQILSGAQDASALMPAGSLYPLPANKVIQVTITQPILTGVASDIIRATHPFHLHGHTFDVIRSAGSSTYNYKDPVRRDVVDTGGAFDNVTIRFVTDNPGPWFLHCHIDWHLEAGLAIVFTEGTPSEIVQANQFPDAWKQLCPIYDSLTPEQKGAE